MNKFTTALLAGALLCMTTLAFADQDKDHDSTHHDAMHHDTMHHDNMPSMDTNGDGLISREEFMNFHTALWDKMPKNKDGLVAVKDMHHMRGTHRMEHMHHGMKGCKDCKDMEGQSDHKDHKDD